MRAIKTIIIWLLILSVVIYVGASVLVATTGKAILSKTASDILGRETKVGSLSLLPPYTISINDLEVKDFVSVSNIKIEPSIISFLIGKIGLNKLVISKPALNLVRLDQTKFNFNEILDNITKKFQGQKKKEIFAKEVYIDNGSISFVDKITNVAFDISSINLSAITGLDLKTRIKVAAKAEEKSGQELADLGADGWINLLRKDMDAKVSLDVLDIAYAKGYFSNFAKNIQSGKILFSSNLVSKNNDLTVDCHVEAKDLVFKSAEAAGEAESKQAALFNNISGIVFSTILAPGSKGLFDFSIHTKLDNPKLEGLKFSGNIYAAPIQNMIQSPKETAEQFKKVGEDFKAIGKQMKEQFKKGDYQGIADMFKVEKAVTPQENKDQGTPSSQAPQETTNATTNP